MTQIKARDLKVGMDVLNWGTVEEISEVINGQLCVTFSAHDYDCGEDEFFPCEVSEEDVFEI